MKQPKRACQKCGGEVHYVYWLDFAIISPLTQGGHMIGYATTEEFIQYAAALAPVTVVVETPQYVWAK